LYGQQKQNYEDMILLVDEIIDDFSKYMPEGVIIWITDKKMAAHGNVVAVEIEKLGSVKIE
jgi:hypothetical protein